MRRNRALARQLRAERTKAQKAVRRAQQGDEKVAVLSEHIEKLMVALRLQAQAKERRQKDTKGVARRLNKERKKAKLMRKKGDVGERVIMRLKEQTEMLAGQLQLADERYADLRSRLDLERRNKNREAQKWRRIAEDRERQLALVKASGRRCDSLTCERSRSRAHKTLGPTHAHFDLFLLDNPRPL